MGRKMFPPSPMAVKMSIDSPRNAEYDILQIYHGGRAMELLSYRTLGTEASLSRRMPEAKSYGAGLGHPSAIAIPSAINPVCHLGPGVRRGEW